MNRYLILSALGACTVVWNVAYAGPPNAPRAATAQVSNAHAAPAVLIAPAAPSANQDAGPRHLSDAERAELRQQLEQFNRQYGKGDSQQAAAPVHN